MPKVEQFSIAVRKFTTIALILPNSVRSVIGPELLSPPYRPIGFQIKTNHDLAARVFPRFVQFACFYSECKLANDDVDFRLATVITYVLAFETQLKTAPILDCIGFALLGSFIRQSNSKLWPITTWSPAPYLFLL